jgi:hypothetical protein
VVDEWQSYKYSPWCLLLSGGRTRRYLAIQPSVPSRQRTHSRSNKFSLLTCTGLLDIRPCLSSVHSSQPAMCHGHPHYHSCGHQSVTWHYCPSALIDLETGYETPCPNITFAASQPSTANCPLANCDFRSAGGGGWTCCKCGGRNSSGWCKNMSLNPRWEKNPITDEWEWIERCDHGCCRGCIKDRKSDCSGE